MFSELAGEVPDPYGSDIVRLLVLQSFRVLHIVRYSVACRAGSMPDPYGPGRCSLECVSAAVAKRMGWASARPIWVGHGLSCPLCQCSRGCEP